MAVLVIPTRSDLAHYRVRVTLDTQLFDIEIHWNDRDGAYWMDIYDVVGNEVATGIKIVIAWPLLHRIAQASRPAGEIMAIDPTGGDDPVFGELGARVTLVYVERASLPAAGPV